MAFRIRFNGFPLPMLGMILDQTPGVSHIDVMGVVGVTGLTGWMDTLGALPVTQIHDDSFGG